MAHPCEESALTAAIEAAQAGLIQPIRVGPAGILEAIARRVGGQYGEGALRKGGKTVGY